MSLQPTGDAAHGSPPVEPRISVVVTSRNDDHGGDPLARLVAHLRFLGRATTLARIPTEEVIVEWNPPRDRPRLAEVLPINDIEHEFLSVRIVTVEPEEHSRLPNSDRLPLFQMLAKNVGLSTARAPLVLTTNIDILIGSEVLRRAAAIVRGEVMTATRVDVEGWRLEDLEGVDDDGRQLWPSVAAVNAPLGMAIGPPARLRRMLSRNPSTRGARVMDSFVTASALLLVRMAGSLVSLPWRLLGRSDAADREPTPFATTLQWTKRIVAHRGIPWTVRASSAGLGLRARTNACGDFLLLHRDDWTDLGGFPAWPVYSWHLDSILLFQAILSGRRPRHLRLPLGVWHLNHDVGSGYSPSHAFALFDRLRAAEIPWVDDEGLALIRYGLQIGPTVRLNIDDLAAA